MDAIIQAFTQNPVGFVVSFIMAIGLIVGFIALTIKLCIDLYKKIKEGKWSEIPDLLLNYMSDAEQLKGADGNTKKEVVLSKVRTYCAENKLQFDENKVSEMIESNIDFSRSVNAKEKAEEAEIEEDADYDFYNEDQTTSQNEEIE